MKCFKNVYNKQGDPRGDVIFYEAIYIVGDIKTFSCEVAFMTM